MKLSVQKSSMDVEGDVIELDNCTATINLTYTQEQIKSFATVAQLFKNKTVNWNNTATIDMAVIPQIIGNLSLNNFSKFTVHLINTDNNIIHELVPQWIFSSDFGGVGYVDCNTEPYSGSSTVKGTVNVAESSFNFKYRSVNIHLVLDFPTHCANGSINKIVFLNRLTSDTVPSLAYHSTNKNILSNVIDRLDAIAMNTSVSGGFSAGGYISGAVNSDGDYVWVNTGGLQTSIRCLVKKGNKVSTGKIEMGIGNFVPRVFSIKNKFYTQVNPNNGVMHSYSALKLKEALINIDEDNNVVFELGDEFIIPRGSKLSSNSSSMVLCSLFEWKSLICMVYRTSNSVYLDIFDSNFNFIKNMKLSKGISNPTSDNTWGSTSHINYYNLDTHMILGGHLIDGDLNDVGIDLGSPGTSALIMSNDKPNSSIGFIKPGHVSGQNSDNVAAIGTTIIQKPMIEIDLEEPLSKTNVETLKLIFDLNISIE